ncbi:MAG: DsbA family protein [Proteobacteria bacterium]|nr:DsbA family protein [Pseudomonadota bacterium]
MTTHEGRSVPHVDFIYGLGSRYSYLAATQIERIARQSGAVFRWRAIQSAMLFERRHRNPFGEVSEGQYDWDCRRRDAESWARYYGVPFRDPVGRLDYPPRLTALAARAAERQGALVAMSMALFGLIFVDDRTAFGREEVVGLARELGLDPRQFRADLDDPGLEDEHDREIDRLIGQGIFGVPTFVVEDGRRFWGNDRLVLLEAALQGRI